MELGNNLAIGFDDVMGLAYYYLWYWFGIIMGLGLYLEIHYQWMMLGLLGLHLLIGGLVWFNYVDLLAKNQARSCDGKHVSDHGVTIIGPVNKSSGSSAARIPPGLSGV